MKPQCTDQQTGKLLHAYELGALESSEAQRFEAHLLECEHCFEQIEAFEEQAFLLHSGRTVRREISRGVTSHESVPSPLFQRFWKNLWPDRPLIFKPAVLLLILMTLFYPAYVGLTSLTGDTVRPVQSISLMPSRSGSTGALSVSADRDGLISFIVPEAIPGQSYRLEIASSDGKILISEASRHDTYRIGRLLIPARAMKPGEYRLTISDPKGDTVIPSGIFNFVIED